ncbi:MULTISPECIES: class I SAM-dependent methyltransferase [unclassified Sinorhizobium]|uniref:class I SAM-dependent methyltransferase n=1 Tax=unclassified Sinorhizobium TaxID=2613772 RepID=UPI0024C3B3E3|nr:MULTISPECIES: class I SAM-dependent methyltransferase [unclassified Sinorhizobium]MDK1378152.1 class I SAM-dependent methyltransferase [Sinorhizobium sp. 6-70]MDK1479799.1 class I SAM-dependent methyltransferase [Sinorhizobium sp. 6-117]
MHGTGLFEGAAIYYSQYQPDYPAEIFTLLTDRFSLNAKHRLLDLGCGTGQLGIPFASRVGRVLCMDPDADMISEARRSATKAGVRNVEFEVNGVEAIDASYEPVQLVTMGRCFHWMPREHALGLLDMIVAEGGGIAIIDKERSAGEPPGWWDDMWRFVLDWHGGTLPAGKGQTRAPLPRPHIDVVAASPFAAMEQLSIPYSIEWAVQDMVGYVLSTSRACPGVLGDGRKTFEERLYGHLSDRAKHGYLIETGTTVLLIATRRKPRHGFARRR